MRTLKEHFNRLPEPYKSQAIANTSLETLRLRVESIYEALVEGFTWEESEQGWDYWEVVRREVLFKIDIELLDDERLDSQKEILYKMQRAGFNVVTCGECGSVILHETPTEEITCIFCGSEGEPCDFPDYYY